MPGAASKAQRRQNGNLSHPQSNPEPNTPKTQAPGRTNGPAWKIPALRNDLNIGTLGALPQAKKHAIELDVASSASASQCLTSEATKLGGDSFKSGLANSALDQAPQVLEEERPKGERPGLPLNDPRGRRIDIPPHVFGRLDHGRASNLEWIKGQDFWTSSQMEGDLPRMRRNT